MLYPIRPRPDSALRRLFSGIRFRVAGGPDLALDDIYRRLDEDLEDLEDR